jgi:hypothetical protein
MHIVLKNARARSSAWLAPAFFLSLLLTFFVVPGSTLGKFNMICFGI